MAKAKSILQKLGSVKITVGIIGLTMILIFIGTMAQAKMGTFVAQRVYFDSWWIYGPMVAGIKIPIFPGGLTIGFIWLVNLVCAFALRWKVHKRDAGILIIHGGIILLLLGQFLTQSMAVESRLSIEEGQTKQFIENSFETELAVIMTSEEDRDLLVSIPPRYFKKPGLIETEHLPFKLRVLKYFPNAFLSNKKEGVPTMATRGVGLQVSIAEIPITTKDDEINNQSIFLEVLDGEESLGVWLISMFLAAPQTFTLDGKEYKMEIRLKREYLPYTMTLKDFRHDVYPGTNIPKNFSSLIHLNDPEQNEDRDVLIYMNHPLRYRGLTFYQASFGKNDTLSVLQVVENPAWLTPYIGTVLVVIGLLIQFMMRLSVFSRRQSR